MQSLSLVLSKYVYKLSVISVLQMVNNYCKKENLVVKIVNKLPNYIIIEFTHCHFITSIC